MQNAEMDNGEGDRGLVTAPTGDIAGVRRDGGIVFGACALVVVTSFWLSPDPAGLGTHEQLFLPPCLFHLLTGLPCAFCGMTTGFALMARGQVSAALAANLLAPAGFVLTIVVGLLGLVAVIRGKSLAPGFLKHPRAPRVFLAVVLIVWVANVILHLQS